MTYTSPPKPTLACDWSTPPSPTSSRSRLVHAADKLPHLERSTELFATLIRPLPPNRLDLDLHGTQPETRGWRYSHIARTPYCQLIALGRQNCHEVNFIMTLADRAADNPIARPAKQSCTNCHRRKVRCDVLSDGNACTNCRNRNLTSCEIYQKKKKNTSRPLSRNVPLIKPRTPHPSQTTSQSHITSHSTSSHTRTSPPSLQSPTPQEPGNLADFVTQQTLRDAEISTLARLCFIGSEPSNFNYLIRKGSSHPIANDQVFHFSNRQYHPKYTSHDLHNVPPSALEIPPKPLLDELVTAYFVHINRGWPIIDEESFTEQLAGKDPRNPLSLPLLNAVLLVGAHVLSAERDDLKDLQATFFRRAKTLIDARYDQDRLAYVQSALLMTWYSDGHEEVIANAWYWIGAATRAAIGLGMHRDTTRAKLVPVPRRTWVRVFWVMFQFDTLISLTYGRPQSLNLDECDVPSLTTTHFAGIPHANTDFAIHHTSLCIIISRAMSHRWPLRSDITSRIRATHAADDSLSQLIAQLPPSLQYPSPSNPNPWQASFQINYSNFLLLLHRCPPKQVSTDQLYAVYDPDICTEARITLVSTLEGLVARRSLQSLSLFEVHAMFTAVVSVIARLDAKNPINASKSMRMLKSLGDSLRALSPQWSFATGLLHLVSQTEASMKRQQANSSAGDNGEEASPPTSSSISTPASTHSYQPQNTSSFDSNSMPAPANTPDAAPSFTGEFNHLLGDFASQDSLAFEEFLASVDGSFQFFY